MTAFSARYAGTCPACDRQIEVGDLVELDEGTVVHAETCTDVVEVPAVACPRCFIVAARNGSCGCDA